MPGTGDKAIALGHPSYVWRFGQDRRLRLIQRYAPLDHRRILDVGCGIGTYVQQLSRFSDQAYGVDIDLERVKRGYPSVPSLAAAQAERLPFIDGAFDVVLLHEVIEHVADDTETLREACRVTKAGGKVVVYAPNRLYPFETHGFYLGKRYIFKLAPLVNYLPQPLRRRFVPHVRAYLAKDLRRLLQGLPVRIVVHTYVYPGFDGLASRHPRLGALMRRIFYFLEKTPLRAFGLSHFLVLEKLPSP